MRENACGVENQPTVSPLSEVDKVLVELKMKMATIEKMEKHKATVINKLFLRMKTPFTKRVINHPLPNKFKTP
jgi:hypothetical protein